MLKKFREQYNWRVCLTAVTVVIAAVSALAGCGQEPEEVPAVTATPTIAPTKKPENKVCRKIGESVPLFRNGKKVGRVKINRITKVRFNDFTNKTAVNNDVNYSYSVNATVSMKESATAFTFVPVCKKNGKCISSVASVGWTGFDDKVDMYGKGSVVLEVGAQPEEQGANKFSLQFSDGDDNEYAAIPVNAKLFKKAVKGPKLRNIKKPLKVKSANGAVYSIVLKKVYFENHFIDDKDHDKGRKNFFDIKYTVKAWKAPKHNIAVQGIRGTGKGATIECTGILGLESMNSSKVLYQAVPEASWEPWSDTDLTELYVNEGKSPLKFGYQRTVVTNRLAESTEKTTPTSVRIRSEFPAEFAARRSLRAKLKCPGRFCVYEVGISERGRKEYF